MNTSNFAAVNTSVDSFLWTPRTLASGSNSSISTASFGNGIFFAGGTATGGSGPYLITSTNGITWTTRTSNFGSTSITASTFGNNTYLIGGLGGAIGTSPDATTWTLRSSSFGSNSINFLTFGNGVFVGGASSGDLRSSTDGVTWTTRTGAFGTSINYADGAFGAGVFVVAGSGSVGTGVITSTNGITWTFYDAVNPSLSSVSFANNIFIAGGSTGAMSISTNGITWNRRPSGITTNETIGKVAFGNGFYVICAGSLPCGSSLEPGTITLTRVNQRVVAG